jgi:hypothetical protein
MAISKEIQDALANVVIDQEYQTAKSNKDMEDSEFETYVDLFDSERPEKDYDWMSDISLPEFPSHMLTQSALDVSQYFQTRDFVGAYLEDGSEEAKANAAAAKECINRTLNQKHLHHYQKYVRAKTINHLQGSVWMECWWEQEIKRMVVGQEEEILDIAIANENEVEIKTRMNDVEGDVIVIDRFNYDVIDPRNVFTDNSYVYDIQDKPFIFIRRERTLSQLEADADRHGYFNLDKLKEGEAPGETETSSETTNSVDEQQPNPIKGDEPFDLIKRYGKSWCKVLERDEYGDPIDVLPGIDKDGNPLEGAELHEVVITYAMSDASKWLIGFNLQPYVDAEGNPYRPLIRGLCYVHPTKDNGIGDGKANRELQTAIDDTFNMGNDRVRLATIPVFKGKKYSTADSDTFYMEPGHKIDVENPDDLQEIQISSDIGGAMAQLGMLTSSMDKAMSIFPNTMGGQVAASTSATAIAGSESRTDMRTNYKSMTFEHTGLTPMYWMIQQMTYQFAQPETGEKLMGDKLYSFDPKKDYHYKPVSASIESEQSKAAKINSLTQLLGYVSNLQHPGAVKIVNSLMARIFELQGDEVSEYSRVLLDEGTPMAQDQPVQTAGGGEPASNQSGLPQSTAEQATRSAI